jgi:hypothetical protein
MFSVTDLILMIVAFAIGAYFLHRSSTRSLQGLISLIVGVIALVVGLILLLALAGINVGGF